MLKFDKYPPDWRLVAITIFLLIAAGCICAAFALPSISAGVFAVFFVLGAFVSSKYRYCLALDPEKDRYQFWYGFVGNGPPREGNLDEISCVEIGLWTDSTGYGVRGYAGRYSPKLRFPVIIRWKKSQRIFHVDAPNNFQQAAQLASGISEFAKISVEESADLKAFRTPLRDAPYDKPEVPTSPDKELAPPGPEPKIVDDDWRASYRALRDNKDQH